MFLVEPWILGTLAVAVLPFAFLAMLKSTVPPVSQKPCHFMARSVSTKSSLNLVQSFVCNLPNNCNDEGEDDVVDQYDGAL
ncbi:hypothetical protein SK128_005031 [Halocaridina rubra]|uniref:Uncharacterized protein n=1 Tax=Halocaridina rubra TaxID=373956 RepID=A0AAN8X628_HALRR